MMKIFQLFILLFALTINLSGQRINCSAFVINQNKLLFGKNLDWEINKGIIVFNPRFEKKKSIVKNNNLWTSKFASITFNQFGKNLPLGGMNEAGLVIEELSVWPANYPNSESSFTVNEFEWIQYNLDNYKNVNEVVENIKKLNISKFYFALHYLVADKEGNSAIIEFGDAEIIVYKGDELPYSVLTNNVYKEHLKSLEHYLNNPKRKLNVNYSQDRFIKLVELLKYNCINIPLDAMNILDSVKVEDTRWSIIYNISDMTVYYKTDNSNDIKDLSFSDFNSENNKAFFRPIEAGNKIEFRELNMCNNNLYLMNLVRLLNRFNNNETKELADRIKSLLIKD